MVRRVRRVLVRLRSVTSSVFSRAFIERTGSGAGVDRSLNTLGPGHHQRVKNRSTVQSPSSLNVDGS
jgi:hypothetical protein